MLLFRRILGFKEETVEQREKRHAQRYPVSPAFPLKVVVNTLGRDEDAELNKSRDGRGRNWGAHAANLSSTGASVRVPLALLVQRGDNCTVTLTIENHVIVQRGAVAHYRAYRDYAVVGIALESPDLSMQRAYLQLLEPLAIGDTLKPVPAKQFKQDTPGQKKELYRGEPEAQLTAWRDEATGDVTAFEFSMRQFYARGFAGGDTLQVYVLEESSDKHGFGAPALKPSPAHEREIQTLFNWIVPNLSTAIPADLRQFLTYFVK